MVKALFFDIDGTLVSFRTHEVPKSTVSALEKAKQKGIKIFISTGRPMAFVTNLGSIAHLIDGYITTNGACCTIGKDTIMTTPLPDDDAKKILSYVQTNVIPCVVMTNKGVAMINSTAETDHVMYEMLNIKHSDMALRLEQVSREPILQITPFIDESEEHELLNQLNGCVASRWFPAFTDITAEQADKGRGLKAVAQALGIAVADTIAFGDGGNDVPILRTAGVGVAMGNATDDVKKEADYITTSVDNDGILNALRHFEVID